MSPLLASGLGYDPHRVAELPPAQRRALAAVALASVPGVALLAVSAGYGAWLASDVIGLSVAVGLGAGFYLLNLLRVAVAGGGVGPQQPLAIVTTWMPRTVPLLMLGLLGAFFAQPVILGLLTGEQDQRVDELRRALGAMHTAAVLHPVIEERTAAQTALTSGRAKLDARRLTLDARLRELAAVKEMGRETVEKAVAEDRLALDAQLAEVAGAETALKQVVTRQEQLEAREVNPYLRALASSHFLLRRVQLTWERPVRASLFSIAMMALMVLPWLASATLARGASRAYEARRWRMNRAIIDVAYAEARHLEAAELVRWPTFEGLRVELHEDAPYNTRPRAAAGAFEARHG